MKLAIPALLLIFLLYLLVFPAQSGPELTFHPSWIIRVEDTPVEEAAEARQASVFPFDLGGVFGYVRDDGRLLHREEKLFGVTMHEGKYINYSSVSDNLIIKDISGQVIAGVEQPGYPLFLDGRLFLIPTNRAGLAEITGGERIAWEREYTSVITDLDVQGGLTAVGLLDSRVQVLDENGMVALELDMKGSRINAVYGCAFSEDAKRVAVIHGIDRQYLSILDVAGAAPEISQYPLETEYRTSRYLRFFNQDSYLMIERKDGLAILDLSNGDEYTLESFAPFINAGVLQDSNLVWAAFANAQASELIVFEPPERVVLRSRLAGEPVVRSKKDTIMLGWEDTLCLLRKEIR